MFDILGVVDFGEKKNLEAIENFFLRSDYYSCLRCSSHSYSSNISRVYVLEKHERTDNCYVSKNVQLFLYGTCFLRNNYSDLCSFSAKKLSARDVFGIYDKFGDKFVKYIKGTFTVVIADVEKQIVQLISDRTNLLPLYYYFKDNLLIFTSSLNMLMISGLIRKEINMKTLAKLAIFSYVPGNETLIEDVFMQSSASILKFTKDKLTDEQYWDIREIITEPKSRFKKREALAECNRLIKDNVNLYTADQDYFAVTLTGGYDSRAVLAVLQRDKQDYFCYSYGKKGCFDITIPRQISSKLGIDYRRFLLDGDFERDFETYALKAVYYSDGLGSITKANFVYPCEKIYDSVDVVLTGLLGSEIIKQPTSSGYYVNSDVRELLFSKSPYVIYNRLVENVRNKKYISESILKTYKNDIFEEICEKYFSEESGKYRFYYFIFREGIRKYFMQQLKIERVYVENRYPLFDDDFFTLIFQTPFAGIYNIKKNRSILEAWKPHLLYAYVIYQNSPRLADYITTHGYKPIDMLSYPRMISALSDYFRYKNVIKNTKTFDYARWVHNFCKKRMSESNFRRGIFSNVIRQKFEEKQYLDNLEEFSRFLSLHIWFRFHGLS